MLLKLSVYGYLNRVQSSRRLEREAGRNVEVMWLTGRLAPDHKTIADFRKDNGPAIRKVCAQFVELCRQFGLLSAASVAIDVVADRGHFDSEEILACDQAGIAVTLPKPMTSGVAARGRFGKQDFRYLANEDVYICPADQRLTYHYTNEENGLTLHRYGTDVCSSCPVKDRCTTGKERRISRWEHEEVLEAVQRRLDGNPQAMRQRRETVEHPFGTIKARMGATHFLMKRLRNVRTEMALSVLACNLTRVMNVLGIGPLIAAIRA